MQAGGGRILNQPGIEKGRNNFIGHKRCMEKLKGRTLKRGGFVFAVSKNGDRA